jgi:hypothetical protein
MTIHLDHEQYSYIACQWDWKLHYGEGISKEYSYAPLSLFPLKCRMNRLRILPFQENHVASHVHSSHPVEMFLEIGVRTWCNLWMSLVQDRDHFIRSSSASDEQDHIVSCGHPHFGTSRYACGFHLIHGILGTCVIQQHQDIPLIIVYWCWAIHGYSLRTWFNSKDMQKRSWLHSFQVNALPCDIVLFPFVLKILAMFGPLYMHSDLFRYVQNNLDPIDLDSDFLSNP